MERKSKSYLTIAHISDLHTPTAGVKPRRDLVDFSKPLIDDLLLNKVDCLVVTGDVADSPIVSKIGVIKSYFNTKDTQVLIDSLATTLESAKTTLEGICRSASIDLSSGLCVIPGNHDLRIQGVLTGNNTYEQYATDTFEDVFSQYYKTCRPHSTYQGGAPIHTTIVPFNSNTNQAAVNFSSGGVTGDELRKFNEFSRGEAKNEALADSIFKICLVHHHPLPIGTAERAESPREQRDGGLRRVAIRLALGDADDLDGVQTNAFRNAGVFLSHADSAGVHLILHGHQHRSWYSHLSYPFRDGERDEKKMLIAAASSIAELSPVDSVSYNLIRLSRDRNIHVEERVLATSRSASFSGGKKYKLYGTRELRGARHRETAHALQNVSTAPLGAIFGVARARGVSRLFAIDGTNGNATVTLSIDGLRPGGEELERLPLMTSKFASPNVVKPSVEVMGVGPKPSVRFAATRSSEGGNDKAVWELQFEPPLEKGNEISLKISYALTSVVHFKRDVDSSDWQDNEYVYYTCATVFPERLTQIVQFPSQWRPRQPPTVMARRGSEVDNEESRSLAETFVYQATAGLALFSTDLPMPGISYGIEWQIDYEPGERTLADQA